MYLIHPLEMPNIMQCHEIIFFYSAPVLAPLFPKTMVPKISPVTPQQAAETSQRSHKIQMKILLLYTVQCIDIQCTVALTGTGSQYLGPLS